MTDREGEQRAPFGPTWKPIWDDFEAYFGLTVSLKSLGRAGNRCNLLSYFRSTTNWEYPHASIQIPYTATGPDWQKQWFWKKKLIKWAPPTLPRKSRKTNEVFTAPSWKPPKKLRKVSEKALKKREPATTHLSHQRPIGKEKTLTNAMNSEPLSDPLGSPLGMTSKPILDSLFRLNH